MTVAQHEASFGDGVEALVCRIAHRLSRRMRPWRLEESLMVIRPAALLCEEAEILAPFLAEMAGMLAGGDAPVDELVLLGEYAVAHFRPPEPQPDTPFLEAIGRWSRETNGCQQ